MFTRRAAVAYLQNEAVKSQGRLLDAPEPATINSLSDLFKVMFFTWMNPLMRYGTKFPITLQDMPELPIRNMAKTAVDRFVIFREKHKSLWRTIFLSESRAFLLQITLGFFSVLCGLAGPYFLYRITGFIETAPSTADPTPAFLFALGFGVTAFLKKFFDNHAWHSARMLSVRIKGVLVDAIYSKSLTRIPYSAAAGAGAGMAIDDASNGAAKSEEKEADASTGKIVTLMSTDAETVRDSMPDCYELLLIPLHIISAISGLLFVVGWPALVGLAVMALTLPLTYWNSMWNMRVYERLLKAQDRRTGVVNEVLQGIRVIKYFAWEKRFLKKINDSRQQELHALMSVYLADAANTFVWLMTPLIVSFVTLTTLAKFSDIQMDSQMAFTCLALFNSLRMPLMFLPIVVSDIFRLNVAFGRISRYLDQSDLDLADGTGQVEVVKVGFEDASFQWHQQQQQEQSRESIGGVPTSPPLGSSVGGGSGGGAFELRRLNVLFPVGKLSVVTGATGAGKSSLLQALLGEMKRISGRSHLSCKRTVNSLGVVEGGVAYVAQTSWLQNATIRDNITFGEPYDTIRYDQVIKACALRKDLLTFEAGDLTEIGEKGINLSGGQKQRVSLARAIYSRASVILMDDPLSAVDAPTARHLFEQAICGSLMAGRTRILVTHATALVLRDSQMTADFLVVMNSGTISASGVVPDILETPAVAALIGVSSTQSLKSRTSTLSLSALPVVDADADATTATTIPDYANGKTSSSATKLIELETKTSGAMKSKYYSLYVSSAGGALFLVLLFGFNVLDRIVRVFNDYWIKLWADSYAKPDGLDSVDMGMFMLRGGAGFNTPAVVSSMTYLRTGGFWNWSLVSRGEGAVFIRCVGSYMASKWFHKKLIERIIFAPMRFFDTTPIGRILNRATKDISVIDNGVMTNFEEVMGTVMDALAVLAVIFSITPIFIFSLFPILLIYYFVSSRFLTCQREMKRLDSITRSPIYSMFSETLVGVSTIRAYAAQDRFKKENLTRVDTNHRAFYYMYGANRWFGVRTAAIGGAVILSAALATVSMRSAIGAGLAGLSLTWTLQFSDYLVWIVRVHAALEMNMNAVERVDEYSEIEQERPSVIESNRPPSNWPHEGAITVSNLEMRYSPTQEPVLKNVSFSIQGGEKVGIVGRTGAGKSSLSLSLFRIVEPSAGSIVIDGIDISTIGLFDLRSKITMIPQDPVLFDGTIRSNLDPFDEYQDNVLWNCLKDVRFMESMGSARDNVDVKVLSRNATEMMLDEVSAVSSGASLSVTVGLDDVVAEGGSNFSQGQRQLLCLARALLKSSTITVFDEATASVDYETDSNIQQVIRGPSFAKTTVLSIAHRLRTIADYDKVLVLDKGRVIQFGRPIDLMQEEGIFQQMCLDSGEYDELLALAAVDRR
ncbi:P-loop containing nucleoside triphosphate hydrolase protein [Obelidium mucronatum]|nr:P-loop containing nucleoside triphosphate hydrolase protein [Obelidium mucronatum]